MDERSAYIILNMIQGVGPVTVRSLVDALGSVPAVLKAGRETMLRVRRVGPELAGKIIAQRDELSAEAEVEKAGRLGISIVTPADSGYPVRLKEIHDPPLALYVKGSLLPADQYSVAIVGTRKASHYGRDCAERLAYELAQAGFVIVSGLALGIDTAAHRGAIKAGGRTVAVLGGGLDSIYPAENAKLADEVSVHGAVISEFPVGRQPDKTTFAIRNRIISGLSLGTVVVEADTRSGAMITAAAALEQGRNVFAVPGRIDSVSSRGPHKLLREGARIVESSEDILDELGMLIPSSATLGRQGGQSGAFVETPVRLDPDERKIVDLLGEGPLDMDTLIRESKMEPRQVSSLLISMEMKKLVRILPGRIVELKRRT